MPNRNRKEQKTETKLSFILSFIYFLSLLSFMLTTLTSITSITSIILSVIKQNIVGIILCVREYNVT